MVDLTCSQDDCQKSLHCRGFCKDHYETLRRSGRIEVRPRLSDEDRHWSKVDASGPCWQWTGDTTRDGYGRTRVEGRYASAHRHTWRLLVGDIEPGLELDHLCKNRACVCPEHLEPVTHAENVRRGAAASKLFCIRGHRLADNRIATGSKGCHACTRKNPIGWKRPAAQVREPRMPVTRCKRGHDFTAENTYTQTKSSGRKSRQCRQCKAILQREYLSRQRLLAA